MSFCETEYISIGGNRQSAAADSSLISGLVAFGADVNVALWQPQVPLRTGICALLKGHSDRVTAVRFSVSETQNGDILVSGDAKGEIRVWCGLKQDSSWESSNSAKGHNGAVNVISFCSEFATFATGGADGTVGLWRLDAGVIVPLHTINLKPRYIPLALVLGRFPGEDRRESLFVAVGGTKATVQVFVIEQLSSKPRHELQATLSGHEGWIRSLSLMILRDQFLLASGSHDKYVRIWRIRQQRLSPENVATNSESKVGKSLTRKIERLCAAGSVYTIVFEALLLGHEDWVYSTSWNPAVETQQLLTASADGSLAIWEPDPTSGIWVSTSRLGEISSQKGATTATGSAGGFWVGLWSPTGHDVMCLDRSGSWRLWRYDQSSKYWTSKPGLSGHIDAANDISWSQGGHYLLSTGSDQTSRLHAEWKGGQKRDWHEFARPQIHGYDLNCITSVGPHQFVSGADEKLLRVFQEPKNVANMLQRLCGIEEDGQTHLPDAASMPVLGLSNKAADAPALPDGNADAAPGLTSLNPEALTISLDSDEPPTEDLLARHTLWPEHEKLYGHGYEISEAVSNDDGTLLATACKASSTDHAVIRLYNTHDWHEIKPSLVAHSLTVTRLTFSCHTRPYLLSVGRDRQWTVFRQDKEKRSTWNTFQAFPKAHSRMILDAAWCPISGNAFFATAGRDKLVKIWCLGTTESQQVFTLAETLTRHSAVTAISFSCDPDEKLACLVVGEEDGLISFHVFALDCVMSLQRSWELDAVLCPAKAVTRVQWRPKSHHDVEGAGVLQHLAVSAADGSVRILRVRWSV